MAPPLPMCKSCSLRTTAAAAAAAAARATTTRDSKHFFPVPYENVRWLWHVRIRFPKEFP